jgi:EAL domain-containing protein (putative c-di-GMP-specific phosphodiesterase class I)/ActR/RegA family two-component response regulator
MSAPLLPIRVLAIDDHPIILRTLRVVLGGLGVTNVDDASSVDVAEEKLQGEAAYDLIVCDLNLPGRDGIEFLRGKKSALAGTGVILLSGEDERILQSVAALGRSAGLHVIAALSKPATADKMAAALERLDEVVPARRKPPREVMPGPRHISEMLAGGMLSMHLQPKVRLSDGELVGVEALLRGKHPDLGDIAPTSIVRAADAQDRAGEITRYVLETSVAIAGRLHAEGIRIGMSINVEGSALRPQLPDILADLAKSHGAPLDSLTVEVAEPAVLVDYVNALEVATRLRLKRCGVALDQFGTGTSALGQLRDLPFSELKIDRSLVTSCDSRSVSRTMIAASVGLGRAFGMQTVAVGVETEAEWKTVTELGVDFAQGTHISPARAEGQIADWAAEWALRQR